MNEIDCVWDIQARSTEKNKKGKTNAVYEQVKGSRKLSFREAHVNGRAECAGGSRRHPYQNHVDYDGIGLMRYLSPGQEGVKDHDWLEDRNRVHHVLMVTFYKALFSFLRKQESLV